MTTNFFHDENAKRLSVGIAFAVLTHVIIMLYFSMPNTQKIISSNTFGAPTNVTIRFISPIKEQAQIAPTVAKVEPVKEKPVVKKIADTVPQKISPTNFNKIEPAAAVQPNPPVPQQEPFDIIKTIQNNIPVVSATSLKGRRIQPEYPKRALRMRQEGVVWLHVLISATGARQEVKLHKPSQYALLNQAAVKAVKKWTFDPNIVNGRAVKSWVEIPVEFKIQ